jgi:hypothetical protein
MCFQKNGRPLPLASSLPLHRHHLLQFRPLQVTISREHLATESRLVSLKTSLTPSLSHRPIFALLIISKAGSLLYHRNFIPAQNAPSATTPSSTQTSTSTSPLHHLSANDMLILAGTFHGVHAITRSLTPRFSSSSSTPTQTPEPTLPSSGLLSLSSSFFTLSCFQTLTGTKFLLFTDPSMREADIEIAMRGIYERFADYVGKNPFWKTEMPVRVEGWEREVGRWVGGR